MSQKQLVEAIKKEEEVKRGVLNGEIPSAVVDSGATSNCGMEGDPYVKTDQISNKIFHMPTGEQASIQYQQVPTRAERTCTKSGYGARTSAQFIE